MTTAPHRHRRTPGRLLLAPAVAASALLLASCSDGDTKDDAKPTKSSSPSQPPATSPAPAPSTDPEAAAKKELLATYQHYWDESVAAYAAANVKGTRLGTYAKGNALGTVQADVKNLEIAGQHLTGKPTFTADSIRLDLKKKIPAATITECVDVSKWTLVDDKTNRAVDLPKDRRTKYVSVLKAERWDKSWVFLESTPRDEPC